MSVPRCATGGRHLPTCRSCRGCWAHSSQSPGSRLSSGLETRAGRIEPARTQTTSTLKAFMASMISFLLPFTLDHFSDIRRGFKVIAASEEEFMWVSRRLQLTQISALYLERSHLAAAELPLVLKDEVPPRSVPLQPLEVPQLGLLQDLQATEEHILLFFQILQMLHLRGETPQVQANTKNPQKTPKNRCT